MNRFYYNQLTVRWKEKESVNFVLKKDRKSYSFALKSLKCIILRESCTS